MRATTQSLQPPAAPISAQDSDAANAFYAFERRARYLFEPNNPLDLSLGECAYILGLALHEAGLPSPAPVIIISELLSPDASIGSAVTTWERADRERDRKIDIHVVQLPIGLRRPWCVLHEATHVATPPGCGHNEQFVRLCVKLWSLFGDWPHGPLMKLAESHYPHLIDDPIAAVRRGTQAYLAAVEDIRAEGVPL